MVPFRRFQILRKVYTNKYTMNKAYSFILLIFLFFCNYLFPQNEMELIATLQGEHNQSEFGFTIACLDFNGDGLDDLVVGANRWDPEYTGGSTPAVWGKIYFYFGGN
jgi:hypothetical protein